MHMCSLVLAELDSIVLTFPVAFTYRDGHLFPVAVLANAEGQSMYVGPKGRWLASYVPAMLRAYPFRAIRQEQADPILHVDEGSGFVVDADQEGERFFDGDEPSQAIKKVQEFLHMLETEREKTARACEQLERLNLLTEWPTKSEDQSRRPEKTVPFADLFRVDQAALKQLDAASLHELYQTDGLRLAILQRLSERHLATHQTLTATLNQHSILTEQEAEDFFDSADDNLRFVWDD